MTSHRTKHERMTDLKVGVALVAFFFACFAIPQWFGLWPTVAFAAVVILYAFYDLAYRMAPEGWEDETGFHYGPDPRWCDLDDEDERFKRSAP